MVHDVVSILVRFCVEFTSYNETEAHRINTEHLKGVCFYRTSFIVKSAGLQISRHLKTDFVKLT